MVKPFSLRASPSRRARVVFPEALSPINQMQKAPLAAAEASGAFFENLGKVSVPHFQIYFIPNPARDQGLFTSIG